MQVRQHVKCNIELTILHLTCCLECIALKFRKNQLYEVHWNLCHPGVTRMYHYVCTKNLPYLLVEVKKMTASCKICAEVKPRFYKPPEMHVIKATKPMERLSIGFKGLIGNLNRNNYMLTVIDEYSRFLFAFYNYKF